MLKRKKVATGSDSTPLDRTMASESRGPTLRISADPRRREVLSIMTGERVWYSPVVETVICVERGGAVHE